MTPRLIHIVTDRPGELARVSQEIEAADGRLTMVVFPEVRAAYDGTEEALTHLLQNQPQTAILLTKKLPACLGHPLVGSRARIFMFPNASIGRVKAEELQARKVCQIVETVDHAKEILAATASPAPSKNSRKSKEVNKSNSEWEF